MGDAWADRSLATFVFAADAQQAHHAINICLRIALSHDFGAAEVSLDIRLQDRIKHIVGRQGILIFLVWRSSTGVAGG